MPPLRPSSILLRAHQNRRCSHSRQVHSPGSRSVLSGSHTPQGLALRPPELHARLQPSPSDLGAPSSPPPTNLLLPRSSAPLAVTSRPASPLLLLVSFPQGAGQTPREPRTGVPSPVDGRGGGVTWAGGAGAGHGGDLRGHFGGVGALRTGVA